MNPGSENEARPAEDFAIDAGEIREETESGTGPIVTPDEEEAAIRANLGEGATSAGDESPSPAEGSAEGAAEPVAEARMPSAEDERAELVALGFKPAEVELVLADLKTLPPKKRKIRDNLIKLRSARRKAREKEEAERRSAEDARRLEEARRQARNEAGAGAVGGITGETPVKVLNRVADLMIEAELGEDLARSFKDLCGGEAAREDWRLVILSSDSLTAFASGTSRPALRLTLRFAGAVADWGCRSLLRLVKRKREERKAKPDPKPAPAPAPEARPPEPEVPAPAEDRGGDLPLIMPPGF